MSIDPTGNEFAREPVPGHIGISGWRIALIKIGVLIALPAFIMGAKLGFKLGFERSLIAFFTGAVILFILGAGTSTIGARARLSTSMLIQFVFGRLGAQAVSAVLAATLTGWFAVTAELFGQSLDQMAGDILGLHAGDSVYIIFGCFLMVLTTIYGIKGLQRVADLIVPLLLFGLATIAYLGFQTAAPGVFTALPAEHVSIGVGISAVIGSMAAGTTILPDVTRFARSPGHGRLAAFLTLAVGIPLVLGLVAIPSVATGEGNLIKIMVMLGLGGPALLLLVFTAWTTNSGNLYSSSLMMGTVTQRIKQKTLVIIIGIVGMALALGGITTYLIPVLLLVGFSVPPIAAVYIADFYVVRRGVIDMESWKDVPALRIPALVAWASGIAVALMTTNGVFTMTTVPAGDSILTALTLYIAFYALGWVQCEAPKHNRSETSEVAVGGE